MGCRRWLRAAALAAGARLGQSVHMSERRAWAIRVMIEASEAQADVAKEAIARALCPDENHPGYCPVPWTLVGCALDDLDADEQATWQENFDDDRTRAREAGES